MSGQFCIVFKKKIIKVVAVVSGISVLEMITRARTHLAIILVDNCDGRTYTQQKEYFQKAAEGGLLQEVEIPFPLVGESQDSGPNNTVKEAKVQGGCFQSWTRCCFHPKLSDDSN